MLKKPEDQISKTTLTPEQHQNEVDYVLAQQILESMLEKGFISLSEFNEITRLNRQSFTPLLAEIMSDKR